MNFKDTFLQLTEYTVPFGYEKELESLLPPGYKIDSVGNYYYEIGSSKTMFTSHLDTACKDRVKINHVIGGNIIKTDGKSILGGDNKAGCLVLFYLIENRVPGTYYFFLGEESSVHSNYPHGSLLALEESPEFFKKFNKVISFDRKEKGQLITRQLGQNCCSEEFANELIKQFKSNGVEYQKDTTGYYTDSAFFANVIPEIVNLSIGVYNEHHMNEYVDISYIEKVAKAAKNINWESLPIKRVSNNKYEIDKRVDFKDNDSELSDDQNTFKEIFSLLDDLYFVCHEFRSYQNYLSQFKPGRIYHFTKWHEDDHLEISVNNGMITSNGSKYYNINGFKKSIGMEKMSSNDFTKLMIKEFQESNNKLTDAEFNYLLFLKGGDLKKLKEDILKFGFEIIEIGKGYEMKVIKKEGFIIKEFNSFKKMKK